MHMDIPRWNLMARNDHGQWTLSGPLDFGDAIVGHCDLFELPTPLICGWRKATRCWRRHCWTPEVCATAATRRSWGAGSWRPH
jgi:hygromycin-B 7''-O-kinase